ncbi:hypothetical protein DFH06DRAFT_1134739 [Mycena polygramma]|nr:hypothetical protein DFH06DRAFT_1134739 [Mycena polygramma]
MANGRPPGLPVSFPETSARMYNPGIIPQCMMRLVHLVGQRRNRPEGGALHLQPSKNKVRRDENGEVASRQFRSTSWCERRDQFVCERMYSFEGGTRHSEQPDFQIISHRDEREKWKGVQEREIHETRGSQPAAVYNGERRRAQLQRVKKQAETGQYGTDTQTVETHCTEQIVPSISEPVEKGRKQGGGGPGFGGYGSVERYTGDSPKPKSAVDQISLRVSV